MPVVRFLGRVHPAELADFIASGKAFRSHLRRYRRLCLAVLQNSVRVFISLPTRLEALCTATQCLAKLIRAMHLIAALSIATHSRARQCIARQRSASLCTATQCTASLCFGNPLLFSSVVIVKLCGVLFHFRPAWKFFAWLYFAPHGLALRRCATLWKSIVFPSHWLFSSFGLLGGSSAFRSSAMSFRSGAIFFSTSSPTISPTILLVSC